MSNKIHWNVLGLLFQPWQIIKKGTWHWKCLIFLQNNPTCPIFEANSTTVIKHVFPLHFQIIIVLRFCNFQQFIFPRVTFWADRTHGEISRVKLEILFVSCWIHIWNTRTYVLRKPSKVKKSSNWNKMKYIHSWKMRSHFQTQADD